MLTKQHNLSLTIGGEQPYNPDDDWGLANVIFIGGDPKTINPAPPKQNMHYRVYKTLATHSTPDNPIYGAELRCHTDDGKISHGGWIRREQSALFLKYIEADREIQGVIRGRPKLFKWRGEYCYRARFYWEVLPAYIV